MLSVSDIAYLRETAGRIRYAPNLFLCGAEFGVCAGDPAVTCSRFRHSPDSRHYSHVDKVYWW